MARSREIINDLTVGSVPKKLLTFALPFMLSTLLQTAYGMVDMMVVGRVIGSSGLSAVSLPKRLPVRSVMPGFTFLSHPQECHTPRLRAAVSS